MQPFRIRTITEFHRLRGLSKPLHPLISVVDYRNIIHQSTPGEASWYLDFYSISLKRNAGAKIKYGQQQYDFDEGVLFFMSPGQVFSVTVGHGGVPDHSGWMLLIHPDFFWNSSLAKTITQFDFFDYTVNEALFLSDKEEQTLFGLIGNIEEEIHTNIDKYSHQIIISQIETLLNYSERFYNRQFITRRKTNHQVLERLETLLSGYFNNRELLRGGLPTVQYVSDELGISPNYLRGLLNSLTGKSTQQHIHEKLIEKAKERLSTTQLSVSEIAYELGFEHPQSFSKLFRTKTNLSPLEFRQSFN